jgi:DNA modification methylase
MVRLYQASADALPLGGGSVHCVCTSPPYYALRRYAGVDDRVLGNEPTPELYLERLVSCFREVRRVLRDDGICWVNIGDTRGGSGKGQMGDGSHAVKVG